MERTAGYLNSTHRRPIDASWSPVGAVRSLWALVQGDPKFMMRLNGWLTILWFVMIPVSIVTGWIESIIFVSAVSIYANMMGHWSTYQAARVEVRQEEAEKKHDEEDLAAEVTQKIIEQTEINPAE